MFNVCLFSLLESTHDRHAHIVNLVICDKIVDILGMNTDIPSDNGKRTRHGEHSIKH